MYDPEHILAWLEENVEGMRRSRAKSLAVIAAGAMRMNGSGVLALGRAMDGPTRPKHRIKRVDRFLGNRQIEVDLVNEALFHQFRPHEEPVVLADWTDRHRFQQLVLALPRDGRAIPFYSVTVEKGDGTGAEGRLSQLGKKTWWKERPPLEPVAHSEQDPPPQLVAGKAEPPNRRRPL